MRINFAKGSFGLKILYVTTISNTMDFFLAHIDMLLGQGHTVDLACNIVKPVNPYLIERGCRVFNLGFSRTPLRMKNYVAYKRLKKLILEENYDIVHTHTPVASAIVRLACKNLNDIKVLYTAHGFHFYKGAPIKNWLIYYPIEKWLSRYTDVLITINKEDYQRAKKFFEAGRVEYIPGVGIDVNKFANVTVGKTAKRNELDLPEDAFVVLSVGELNKNKNHEVIIKAIAKLNNPNIYYVICGQGSLEGYLKELANNIGIDDKVKLLGYRGDIPEILKVVDVFAFPSRREGLPVALMEAIASGLPCIASKIRGNIDLFEQWNQGLFHPTNVDEIASCILKQLDDNCGGERMTGNIEPYRIKNVISVMENIYERI